MPGTIRTILLFLALSLALTGRAQRVVLQVEEQPLPEVFQELKARYQVQFSFDLKVVEGCKVSANETFANPEAAVSAILQPCDLAYRKVGEVFVIYLPRRESIPGEPPKKPSLFKFAGQVIDVESGESLPFASLQIETSGMLSDEEGRFAYRSTSPKVKIKVSHLGYQSLDTTLAPGNRLRLSLVPQSILLETMVMEEEPSTLGEISIQSRVGVRKANHEGTREIASPC